MKEINSSRIKLSQLKVLVAVAEYGNFSEAGLYLDLSQSAISHAIAALEAELGVTLLSRGRHGAQLTPVGERVLIHARQVLHQMEAMVKEADLAKGLNGGSVRIACFRSVATHILPAVIVRFRQRFPEITVNIAEYPGPLGAEQALREGRSDIGFVYLPNSDEFRAWEILRDDYVVLLPPTAQLENTQLSWEQLAAYPLILSSSRACHHLIRTHLQQHDFPANIAYDVQESSTVMSMVAQGLGATILARLSAEPIPPQVKVCSLPVPLERVIGVAVMANALLTPAVYAFLENLRGDASALVKYIV